MSGINPTKLQGVLFYLTFQRKVSIQPKFPNSVMRRSKIVLRLCDTSYLIIRRYLGSSQRGHNLCQEVWSAKRTFARGVTGNALASK